ncbi:ATP-dependent Clp protease ATP-binding subunit [Patescibacteria group bacterium]|nr:ATP-dependent Clp protease ATP-binding subunit [Patescibacteria group bacterium]
MAYVDVKRTKLYRAVRLGRIVPTSLLHPIAWLGALAALISLALWAVGVVPTTTWRLFSVASVVAYVAWVYALFFGTYLDTFSAPPQREENLAAYLDYRALKAVAAYGGGDITTLLLPLLSIPGMQFVLMRIGTTPRAFRKMVKEYLRSAPVPSADPLPPFLGACLKSRADRNLPPVITWQDLFSELAIVSPFMQTFILEAKLEAQDIRTLLDWQVETETKRERAHRFWSAYNLMRTRSVGRTWAAGYTPELEKYAVEVNKYAGSGQAPELYGRVAETEEIERVLARDGKNNVVLVGPEGVGKTVAVSALAERIALGDALTAVAHKRVLELRVASLLGDTSNMGDIESRFESILNDAVQAGNVILLIDDIHTLFDPSGAAGTIDATRVLLPYLASERLQVIGLTTDEGYHETIARHADLMRLFEKVEIREPLKEEVYAILRAVIPHIEAHNRVWFLYQAVKAAVELSDRYVKNAPFPEKTIGVLQEAAVFAVTKGNSSVVTATHVEEVVRQKTQIPVGEIARGERATLLNLETLLHARVVGQDEAISAIANTMRRARAGTTSAKKPIGSFLFLGPTGVGKTETAKALAAAYFGSEKRMIRFDMSEYQQADSINRLIGHDAARGALTTAIMDDPFSLVLLDELEKANSDVLNVFLQVLDEGRLTDALGRTTDFTNAIIIATSNAGAELIRESVAQEGGEANLRERVLETLQTQGIFKPEFLNRFDDIIMFKPLSREQMSRVAELLLVDLNERLKDRNITVHATPEALAKLVELGFDQEFGARPLRRVVQDKVENLVAQKLLEGTLNRGDTLSLAPENI